MIDLSLICICGDVVVGEDCVYIDINAKEKIPKKKIGFFRIQIVVITNMRSRVVLYANS